MQEELLKVIELIGKKSISHVFEFIIWPNDLMIYTAAHHQGVIKMFELRSSCIIHLCVTANGKLMLQCPDITNRRCFSRIYTIYLFSGDTVKIGAITYKLKTPQNPEFVPVKHSM